MMVGSPSNLESGDSTEELTGLSCVEPSRTGSIELNINANEASKR